MGLAEALHFFVAFTLRLFFLLTPFFALSSFLALTSAESSREEKHRLAVNVTVSATAVCISIFLFGDWIMAIFGITVAAFRAGSGLLLMLSAVALVYGSAQKKLDPGERLQDLATVPLAVPITAGPATLGALMVSGMDTSGWQLKCLCVAGIICGTAAVGVMLYFSDLIEGVLGKSKIAILSKVTGLILSAIAAQMLVAGVRELFYSP
ncbi:MAG: MarC family protein [Oligosphaeraceae bacterium]|jgi:multiple antibiotic resistance protein|nr:MarC family protein [Oligosphaeraceae bacterium]